MSKNWILFQISDKKNISYFVSNYLYFIIFSDSYSFNEYKLKLIKKLGNNNVEKWLENFSKQEILSGLNEIIKDTVQKVDTHRYNDDIVECFFNAGNDGNKEEVSACQYKIHVIEVAGENLSSITDEL